LARIAAELGRDPPAFAPAFLAVVRRLLEAGILVPHEFVPSPRKGGREPKDAAPVTTTPVTSYDDLPYDDNVFPYTQPTNLAAVAALHGLDPPPFDRCRVLDIGCATGTNLLPMALARPRAEFVGLDLSPRQIASGQETIARLGLTNVALWARDIMGPTDDLGTFDYVICHGVYSWVPPAVQDRILAVIRRHLAPAGLAYVSYNTYPGWHLRGMVRDMLAFHDAAVPGGPAEKVVQARAFLDFLVDALPEKDTVYATSLRRDAEQLRPTPDSYVYHEHLEADNRPVYFHQFAAHAAGHGLQYLAEASPVPLPGDLKPGVLETLANLAGDRVRLEQYLDFLRCRIFRRSVLCHAAARPDLRGAVKRIPAFAVSSTAEPTAAVPDPDPGAKELFTVPSRTQFATADPALRAVLSRLWQARPAAVPFADLLTVAHGPGAGDALKHDLANGLLQMYLADIIALHLHPPAVTAAPGPRPCASPFARLQAERGDRKIFTLVFTSANPDPFARYLLPLLNGARTRDDLVELLAARAAAGAFAVNDNEGRPVTDPAVVRPVLAGWIDAALEQLAKAALLMA
jgi:SAM-dependent methyltransferase